MFEKFKKPCCTEFYNAYDSLLKNYEFHLQFFNFFKEKLDGISSTDHAYKDVIRLFIEFIRRFKTFYTKIIPQEDVEKRSSLYLKIFDYCCCDILKVSAPSDIRELDEILFQSQTKSLEIFKHVQCCKSSKKFSSYSKDLLLYLIDEFIFIRAFSSFLYKYKNAESIDFFKRFFFIYPFDKEEILSERNNEWIDYHKIKFETIKKYPEASKNELKDVRKWFKKQLDKVDFAAFSEENKSIFVTEMFVAFGTVSNAKTGDVKGFRCSLNNLFYLGRYYNVHCIPFLYLKEENRKMLENIAYETWRRICNLNMTQRNDIEEKKGKNSSGKMSEPSTRELYGKNAPRVDIERLEKQYSEVDLIKPGDNSECAIHKVISSLDVSILSKTKSKDEVIKSVIDSISSLGIKDVFKNSCNESTKSNILASKENIFKMVNSDFIFAFSWRLTIKKLVGLITHFDVFKRQDSLSLSEKGQIFEGFVNKIQ